LVRVHFLADTDPRSLRPGIAYALLEAGMTSPDAATGLRDNLCEATGQPLAEGFTHVSASAEGRRGNRMLRLTDFGRQLISRNLELMRQADFAAPDRLTYGGTGFGLPKAAASVQGYLNNHATWAGVDDRQTNVTGIALWRQNQILHADGLDAALDCAFGDLLTGDEDRYLPLASKLLKHLHRAPSEARRFIRH
jgi:hypothetical protein